MILQKLIYKAEIIIMLLQRRIYNSGILFVFLICAIYGYIIIEYYFMLPWAPDHLQIAHQIEIPYKYDKFFFRYFAYYFAKIFTMFVSELLYGIAYYSIIIHVLVIYFSFAIVYRLSNRTSAILAASLASSVPVVLFQSTWFSSDISPLLFGLIALYYSLQGLETDRLYKYKYVISGFFLVASIYSKTTGIVFLIPIMILVFYEKKIRNIWPVLFGGIVAFIFIIIGDTIWLNDYYYHINPVNYLSMINKFFAPTIDYINQGTSNWGKTFRDLFARDNYMQYLIYMSVFITIYSVNINKGDKQLNISFIILLISIISLLLHELVHVFNPKLNIHFRWSYTVIIPVILAFCIALPKIKQFSNYKYNFCFDMILLIAYLAGLIFSIHEIDFWRSFIREWNIFYNIVRIFSLWFLLCAIFIFLVFVHKTKSADNFNKTIVRTIFAYVGLACIVFHSVLFGNFEGRFENNKFKLSDYDGVRRGYLSRILSLPGKVMYNNLHGESLDPDNFAYAYYAGALSSRQYNLIKTLLAEPNQKFSYETFVNQGYTTLVTTKSLTEVNNLVNNNGVVFSEFLRFGKHNLRAFIIQK